MTDAERAKLATLDRDVSLAALTSGLGDDESAAKSRLGFLEGILGAVQSSPARGGDSVIRDIADQVKQARDNVASFTGGTAAGLNESGDLQAQIAQRDEQLRVARRESEINARALATFQGAGDIGMGGRVVQNIYTLHPGDPATLRAVGDAATAGQSLQPYVTSTRSTVGP